MINNKFAYGNVKLHEIVNNEKDTDLSELNINVYRNTGFEFLIKPINYFMSYFKFKITFNISNYSDVFNPLEQESDIDLIFFDFKDIEINFFADFITEFQQIRGGNGKPLALIAINASEDSINVLNRLNSILVYILEENFNEVETLYTDKKEILRYSASNLNPARYIEIAQFITSDIILTHYSKDIRVIFVDFDDTLYSGVLAEDGIESLVQNDYQIKLYRFLLDYQLSGGLVVGVTRNIESDVINLLDSDKFLLSKLNFYKVHASWNEKMQTISDSLVEINLSPMNALFIDDNSGEISKALLEIPSMLSWHFNKFQDNDSSRIRIPGVSRFLKESRSIIDRASDLKANEVRRELATSGSDLRKLLNPKIELLNLEEGLIQRAKELSQKTNQFNLTLRRTTEEDFWEILDSNNKICYLIGLKDNLSDSGIIALISGLISEDSFLVEEFDISCRALGRNLENEIFLTVITRIFQDFPDVNFLNISSQIGPRNMPALEWLQKFSKQLGQSTIFLRDSLIQFDKEVRVYGDE